MPHEDYMKSKGSSKSKYSGKMGGGMDGNYHSEDMKSTTMDKGRFFRPMDKYQKGHEY